LISKIHVLANFWKENAGKNAFVLLSEFFAIPCFELACGNFCKSDKSGLGVITDYGNFLVTDNFFLGLRPAL
jgi:hypothetical protein